MFDKTVPVKKRLKAFFNHLLLSFFLVLVALYMVYGIWYPKPLNIAVGVSSVYFIMLCVDLVIGPLCTLIVYKSDRKKMIFDIFIIIIIQLAAYSYGLWIMEKGRPAWQVFVIDDIELVSPIDLHTTNFENEFKVGIFDRPKWVAAIYSSDPQIEKQQKEDEMFDGISLATRPETYQKLQVKSQEILKKIQPIDGLKQFNSAQDIKKELSSYSDINGWLPVKASSLDMVALFNKNGDILGVVNLRPWGD